MGAAPPPDRPRSGPDVLAAARAALRESAEEARATLLSAAEDARACPCSGRTWPQSAFDHERREAIERAFDEGAADMARRLERRHAHPSVLHGVFKRAKRVWSLEGNPASADLVERPQVVYSGEFDTFDRGEIERLLSVAHDPQDAAIYRVATFTGLRQGELLALRWRDADFVGGLLHVRKNYTDRREKEYPKGRKVRSVPMTPDVVDALGRLKEREHFTADDDLVFCNTVGDHLDAWALRRRFYCALERAGLRRIRFHDLRHHFGTHAITALDAYAVQSYMGHAHYSTTQRYLHHKPRPEHAQALHRAFGGRSRTEPSVSSFR